MEHEGRTTYRPTDGEQGGMTTWCMLFCLIAVSLYLKGGHEFLSAVLPTPFHLALIAVVACACFFTICCQIHLIIRGEQSPRQLRRTLRKQLKELSIVTSSALERLAELESTLSWQSRLLRPVAYDHGARAQELVSRLVHRGREVERLIASRRKENLFVAAQLLGSPLGAFENCQEELIKVRPIPALLPDQWVVTLEQLLQAAEFEVERAETRMRSVQHAQ